MWHEDSKTRSNEWVWRDQLNPVPDKSRLDPPLLETYRFGRANQVIFTNEEATQSLEALGQIVVNLSVSAAFPACKALAGKTGAHITRPYHTCNGLVPDPAWVEQFALKLEPVDRDAAEALRQAIRAMPGPIPKAPPGTQLSQ